MAQEQGLVTRIRKDGWAQVVTERRDATLTVENLL